MIKLVALYKKPVDTAKFDEHFDAVHVPLIRQIPGLQKLEITRIIGAPIGESKYHVMAELYFESRDAMDRAVGTREGKALLRDLMSFAATLVTAFHGETSE